MNCQECLTEWLKSALRVRRFRVQIPVLDSNFLFPMMQWPSGLKKWTPGLDVPGSNPSFIQQLSPLHDGMMLTAADILWCLRDGGRRGGGRRVGRGGKQ